MRTQVEPIGAAILAGGKSSRMGRNKALLPYGKARLVDHMVHMAGELGCSPIVVSGSIEGYRCIEDAVTNAGPVSGIHAVIEKALAEDWPRAWLFVPVDMPLVMPELLNRLSSCACTYDHDGACFEERPLPLFLRLHDKVVDAARQAADELVAGKEMSVRRLLEQLEICKHPVPETDAKLLINANTPEDWERLTA